jgi:hypothetical protein
MEIDPKFIEMILDAKRDGKLVIVSHSDNGAHLQFPYMQTQMELHLAAPNWAIVREALTSLAN